jgi:hypothetical protein
MSLQGRSRLGPYRLLTRVGEGGLGVVYLGLDDWGRAVAVRALRPLVGLNYPADVLRQVSGRHVAELYAAAADAGTSYVATRYVPGRPLDAVLAEDGPFGGRPLVRLARGLADGLCSLQEAGVVHGLLGPGTVLVEDGDPVIIDIGIAQTGEGFIASLGQAWGPGGFAAPEVDRERASAASDVYTWGALVTYAATGRPPYSGRTDAVGLPEPIAGLVLAALSPDPRQRPTARQLRDRIDTVLGGPPPEREPAPSPAPSAESSDEPLLPEPRRSAESPPAEEPRRRWRRAHRLIGVELLALIAVLAAIAPAVTAIGVVAIILALRFADHVTQAAVRRHAARGSHPWNPVRAVLVLPWHVVRAVLETALFAPMAGLVAALGTAPAMLGAEEWRPTATMTIGTAAAVGLFVAASWLGPGGRPLRRVTEQILRAVVPSRVSAILAFVALAGGLAGLATIVFAEPQDWWPLESTPNLDWLLRR